jgi:hypothetical protein
MIGILIEIQSYDAVSHFRFVNAEEAEAFRVAAEKAVTVHDEPVKVTLWYRGYKYSGPATEIAHYYQSYPYDHKLYAPDGQVIYTAYSYRELKEWAQKAGFKCIVSNQFEAARLNGYSTDDYMKR